MEQEYNYLEYHQDEDKRAVMAIFMPYLSKYIYKKEKRFPFSSKHVLVIEHNPAIRDMLCRTLELAGYRVTGQDGGDGWIEHARESNDSPALVLLDLSIPSMCGTAFLQQIRAQWKTVPPIIILTTNRQIYDELVTVERVLYKPFHICELLSETQLALSQQNSISCRM